MFLILFNRTSIKTKTFETFQRQSHRPDSLIVERSKGKASKTITKNVRIVGTMETCRKLAVKRAGRVSLAGMSERTQERSERAVSVLAVWRAFTLDGASALCTAFLKPKR